VSSRLLEAAVKPSFPATTYLEESVKRKIVAIVTVAWVVFQTVCEITHSQRGVNDSSPVVRLSAPSPE